MKTVQVIGRLGADAEVIKSKTGNEFLTFRVASDEYIRNERSTQWYRVSWAGPAKMKEYLTKGKPVCVSGREEISVYQSKSGEHLFSVDVFADRVEMLSFGNSGQTQSSSDEMTTEPLPEKKETAEKATVAKAAAPQEITAETDDDLPF